METVDQYCPSVYRRQRLETIEVDIGGIKLGGMHPIRVQSMTTTDTMDTEATIAQSLRMAESGAEYVRITAPSIKEAKNLEVIRKGLRAAGCTVPLIADIHYTPNAAEVAARLVEKVRVNPGNYVDKKKFQVLEYTDLEYEAEIERIHKRFAPLVKICKEYGTAMRIGTNHGSLSDRIMSRYGDTPLGMVESALEFLRICEHYNYDQVVLSMKASNPQVMVQAYRLLAQKMIERGKVYPTHLGVTEAGEGEDGRIKSAQGIGALLMDGIGDTVRVSLTEEPEYESPVARFLIDLYTSYDRADLDPAGLPAYDPSGLFQPALPYDPFAFNRRESGLSLNLGHSQVPRVVADFPAGLADPAALGAVGYSYSAALDKYHFSDMAADFAYLGGSLPGFELPGGLKAVYDYDFWVHLRDHGRNFPLFSSWDQFMGADGVHGELNFVEIVPGSQAEDGLRVKEEHGVRSNEPSEADGVVGDFERVFGGVEDFEVWKVGLPGPVCLVIREEGRQAGHAWRHQLAQLMAKGIQLPVILKTSMPDSFPFYDDSAVPEAYRMGTVAMKQLFFASVTGSLVVDGLIDGLWVTDSDDCSNRSSFGVLQASRLRITKTEYISCPSCGRTLFDLQETTARIRKQTEHLKGVKIGIMGCIVNGPGEMADADYGYVGVGPGKIALYRGKEVVERGVKTEDAVDKLIDLIREDGKWFEPSVTAV